MSIDPSKIVTQEQHDAVMAKVLEESPDFVIVRETPAADVRRAEELLGIKEGTLTNTFLRFAKGDERCLGCGRQFNVLDMITAALKVHTSEFIKEVMFGDAIVGMSYNDEVGDAKAPVCADCGKRGPGPFVYSNSNYHWIKD